MHGYPGATKQDKEAAIRAVQRIGRAEPELSATAIATRVGISHVTARRYLALAGLSRKWDAKKGCCVAS